MDERYERILDDAQKAVDRRNRARHELEYMLDADRGTPEEEARSSDTPESGAEPETWRRLPV